MTKTICDLSGDEPAANVKLVTSSGTVLAQMDLCQACIDNLLDTLHTKAEVAAVKVKVEVAAVKVKVEVSGQKSAIRL